MDHFNQGNIKATRAGGHQERKNTDVSHDNYRGSRMQTGAAVKAEQKQATQQQTNTIKDKHEAQIILAKTDISRQTGATGQQ